MKPLSLNLSKMKKVAGDKHSSTFQHPDGHHMVIAHAGVSHLQKKQLEEMPIVHLAEGGPSSSDPSQEPFDPDALTAPTTTAPDVGVGTVLGNLVGTTAKNLHNTFSAPLHPGDNTSQQPASSDSQARAPSSQAVDNTSGMLPPNTDFAAAYKQGQAAISEQQKIDAAKAKANEDIQAQDMLKRQDINQSFQDNLSDFQDHQQKFMQDYANNHIDPKHYVENMSLPNKILTGVGLFLGGNGAVDNLNKLIDRDIAGQQSRQDQQKTLLGANQEFYKDKQMGLNQTRINMNDIYDHNIQLAASKLGTPQAKANADMAHFNLAAQNNQLLQQNAMRAAVLQHVKLGGTDTNAIDLANAQIIPQAEAVKEQGSIDKQKQAIAKTQELFNSMNEEQTPGNTINPQSYQRYKQLHGQLVQTIIDASPSKRLTKESVEQEIAPFDIKTWHDPQTRVGALQGVMNIIQKHAEPTPYMSHYAKQALPQYNAAQQAQNGPREGQTGTDKTTGKRVIVRNGKVVPLNGQ